MDEDGNPLTGDSGILAPLAFEPVARKRAAAWDRALALHHRRNPRPPPKGRPSRGEILAGSGGAWPARAAPPPPGPVDPEAEERATLALFQERLEAEAWRERVEGEESGPESGGGAEGDGADPRP